MLIRETGTGSIEGIANRLPNFFVVGAPKAGTTSLYRYLRQHPEIYMSPVKEPNYFASEVRPEAFCKEFRGAAAKAALRVRRFLENPGAGTAPQGMVSEWEDYLKLFRNAKDEVAVGEASVCYLWSATAAANIRAKAPEARIIMILRDPAERAFSQYLNNAADGVVSGSFRQQIERAVRNTTREFQPLYPFLENGLYYEQVKRYLDLFPREQVRIFLYEEAWQDATRLLAEVFEFLGADAEFKPDFGMKELERRQPRSLGAHYLLNRSGAAAGLRTILPAGLRSRARSVLFKPRSSIAMEAADRRYLRDYYRDDVKRLEQLLGRDLRPWLDSPS